MAVFDKFGDETEIDLPAESIEMVFESSEKKPAEI